MVVRTVPKSAIFREVSGSLEYEYQIAGVDVGLYICTNPLIDLMPMVPNSFYLIDTMSVCGSVAEAVFVESLTVDFLSVQFLHYLHDEIISARKESVSQYYKEKSLSTHVTCNRDNDGIRLRVTGKLNQVPSTIGVDYIYINVSLGVYEIDGREYNKFIRDYDL